MPTVDSGPSTRPPADTVAAPGGAASQATGHLGQPETTATTSPATTSPAAPQEPGRELHLVYLAMGYGALALSVAGVLFLEPSPDARPPVVGALSALAAGWLVALRPVYRHGHRTVTVGWYAGQLTLGIALLAVDPRYILFATVAYPLAFALLAPRWAVTAVAINAVLMLAAQGGGFTHPTALDALSPYAVIAALAVPLVSAAVYVSVESERRHGLIAELTGTNNRLRVALAENAELHERLVTQARAAGVLAERHRMAGEIHDTMAQGLTALISQLRAADQVPRGSDDRERHLSMAQAMARETLAEARRSVLALRPQPLDRAQLPDALSELAERWSRTAAVPVAVEVTGTPRPLSNDVEVTLYRVAQEAFANVARHAQASRVGLTLSYLDDVALLDIRDDGVGFAAGAGSAGEPHRPDGTGFGLDSMRRRLRDVNGTLEIETAPGEGTALAVCVPAVTAH